MINDLRKNLLNSYEHEISKVLSSYTEKIVNQDKTITYKNVVTDYF